MALVANLLGILLLGYLIWWAVRAHSARINRIGGESLPSREIDEREETSLGE